MFHLDNNSGVSSMPAVAAKQESATRWFTEGAGNQRPSWPGQDWFNIVQAELLNVLAEAGIPPDKAALNQLALAIKSIVNKRALLRDNLLSEIKGLGASAQALSRKNLGLGTAATVDVQTSRDDVTPGRALINGSALALRSVVAHPGGGIGSVADANDLPGNSVSFVYNEVANSPGFNGSLIDFSGLSGDYNIQISADYGVGKKIKFRTRNGDPQAMHWNAWNEFYHTENKPTAADTEALSIYGGTVWGRVQLTGVGDLFCLQSTDDRQASYIVGKNAAGGGLWYLGKGSSGYNIALQSYAGANSLTLAVDGYVTLLSAQSKPVLISASGQVFTFNIDGTFAPPSYYNFDQRYPLQDNVTVVGFSGGNETFPYLRFRPNNHDIYLAPRNTASLGVNGWHRDASTGLITQWGRVNSAAIGYVAVNFPIAFPSVCVDVSSTVDRTGVAAGADNWSSVTNVTRTGFYGGSDRFGFYWRAIGY